MAAELIGRSIAHYRVSAKLGERGMGEVYRAHDEAGNGADVFVRPFPAGEGRWQISTPNGSEPRWSPDQGELYYRSGFSIYRVAIDSHGGAIVAGKPEMAVDRVTTAGSVHTYAPAPDGRVFTPRSPTGRGAARTVDLDLGFARRLDTLSHQP